MAGAIPTSVLSEALIHAIDGRTVKTAVFTTFAFEPGFFEEETLPVLFHQSFSHVPAIRKVQLEEKLRYLDHVAVYYDRQALVTGNTSASLDFERVAISRRNGCFHPKMVFLLCEDFNENTEKISTSLLVAVMSANLTRAGWWDNVECAHIEEVKAGSRCAFRSDLLSLCKTIRKHETTGSSQEAIQAVYKFLRYQVSDAAKRKHKRVMHPRIFVGDESFPEFLNNHLKLPANTYNLEVVSPFFDQHNAATLANLVEAVQPKQTRVFLAQGHSGAASCSQDYFNEVQAMPNTFWAKLPQGITQRSNAKSNDALLSDRYTHAKVYRLFSRSEGREYIVTGSVNLTRAAHSKGKAGNLETAVVIDMGPASHTQFWLSKLGNALPSLFCDDEEEEGMTSETPPPITLRYHWGTREASYFFDKTNTNQALTLKLSAQGEDIGELDECTLNEWVTLAVDPDQIERILRCTSFFQVAINNNDSATILVCEGGMAHKPSLLANLSPEDILRYWSLLSPEQREAFLESKLSAFLRDQGITATSSGLSSTTESLFDGFAGIFHAFARLKEHIVAALDAGRNKDAEYRLVGDKYDSLPVLLQKVIEDEQGDLVTRYITLLTAKMLVDDLEALYPNFFENQALYIHKLKEQIELLSQLRDAFSFDSPQAQKKFFNWLENHFLAPALVEGAA